MTTITVSRHYGSGGRKVAARVRELLNYRFFDKLFMMRLASEVGLSQKEIVDFSEVDYKVKSFVERLLSFNPAEMVMNPSATKDMALADERFDDTQAINLVKLTVRAAHDSGNIVIAGRGSQVILKGQPDVLHVRVIAPMETRLQRLQEVEGLSLQEARQRIKDSDKAGQEYLERFFNEDWDNPYLYHLTLNTGLYDVEQAAQLIVQAVNSLAGVTPAAS